MKPPIMNDEGINTALKDYTHYFYDSQGGRYEGNWAVLKIALEAQRDADAEWYENNILDFKVLENNINAVIQQAITEEEQRH